MAIRTQRITVLMSSADKERVARLARRAGLSTGEYLRRAAAAYNPGRGELALAAMLEHVERSTSAASAAIDRALAYVEASEKRITAMEIVAATGTGHRDLRHL